MKTSIVNDISTALRLFASIFQREVDRELLREIRAQRNKLQSVLGADPLTGLDLEDLDATLETRAVEYCRLFIGPHGHMPPVESIARGEERFWGPSTDAVAGFYKKIGMAPKPDAHTFPDHISMELDCLALLEEQDRHHQAKIFAREHLFQWLPKLIEHIDKRATIGFYGIWAKGLQIVLEQFY